MLVQIWIYIIGYISKNDKPNIVVNTLLSIDNITWVGFKLHFCHVLESFCPLNLCSFMMDTGTICMEIARQYHDSHFLSLAVRSLTKAQKTSFVQLPVVSLLLAQAEGSLSSIEKWEKNLRLEWFTWPPGLVSVQHFFACLTLFICCLYSLW